MSSTSHCGPGPLDAFVRPGAVAIAEHPQLLPTRSPSPLKRVREDREPPSDSDDDDANTERMDFQQAENIMATQALGDEIPAFVAPHVPPPLSAEHAALHSDFEIITQAAMERLYIRITEDIMKSVKKSDDDAAIAYKKTTDLLHSQISSLGSRVTQLQQQLLAYQKPVQPPTTAPTAAPAKKILKLQLTKKTSSEGAAATAAAGVADTIPQLPTITTLNPSANTRGWETIPPKLKTKASTPKLIPTKYPQAEREVTCHFQSGGTNSTNGFQPEKTYSERQMIADLALRHVNSAIVDNKDVFAPPIIRARVPIRGNIIFTTGNTQNNLIYEDYTTIITDALSYYGQCQKVEIGKRFSQFLLHGMPTHLSIPEISQSLSSNYRQLVQGETSRWLTPTERREHKANSTVVITLTGTIKRASIGGKHLIVCNRECQLDDYIAYGGSTQCHNFQIYGHPAALCRNRSRCAVCAGPHETQEHPCMLPICKKGPTCTHAPIRCVNCDAPHKASDHNCPEHIKLRNLTKPNTNATNQGDAPIARVAA